MKEQHNYYIEYFKNAREELLFRVKHRDTYFKVQILIQFILWGIANGIGVGQITINYAIPWVLYFSLPISSVFIGLYFVEDQLIHRLSKYISNLLSKDLDIKCWDSSDELKDYSKTVLIIRFITQIFGFFILPVYLTFLCIISYDNTINCLHIIILIVSALFIIIILIIGFRKRFMVTNRK